MKGYIPPVVSTVCPGSIGMPKVINEIESLMGYINIFATLLLI